MALSRMGQGSYCCPRRTVPHDLGNAARASRIDTMPNHIQRQDGDREELGILHHALCRDAFELLHVKIGTFLLHTSPRAARRRAPRRVGVATKVYRVVVAVPWRFTTLNAASWQQCADGTLRSHHQSARQIRTEPRRNSNSTDWSRWCGSHLLH